MPIIKGLPGFKAFHVVDWGGRGLMFIGFGENKVAATKSSELAREWVLKSALGLATFPPDKLEGDTVLDIG